MKLTRRQEEFIRKLLDLYRESEGPIHYSEVADRLGVNRFTAYDMLRLLEKKGLAASEYQLAKDKSGPGRATVVFMPTPQAHRMISELTGETGGLDWEAVKDRILGNIRSGQVEMPILNWRKNYLPDSHRTALEGTARSLIAWK